MKNKVYTLLSACAMMFSTGLTAADATVSSSGFVVALKERKIELTDRKSGKIMLSLGALTFNGVETCPESMEVKGSSATVHYSGAGEYAVRTKISLNVNEASFGTEITPPKNVGVPYFRHQIKREQLSDAQPSNPEFINNWEDGNDKRVPDIQIRETVYPLSADQTLWIRTPPRNEQFGTGLERFNTNRSKEDFTAGFTVFRVESSAKNGTAASASNRNVPLINLKTSVPFNIFHDGTPSFSVNVVNTRREAMKSASLSIAVYDFEGKKILEKSETLELAPGQEQTFQHALPQDSHNMWFVEARIANVFGDKALLNRMNIASFVPVRLKNTGRVGISSYYSIPGRDNAQLFNLMKDIGVGFVWDTARESGFPTYLSVSLDPAGGDEPDGALDERLLAYFMKRKDADIRGIYVSKDMKWNAGGDERATLVSEFWRKMNICAAAAKKAGITAKFILNGVSHAQLVMSEDKAKLFAGTAEGFLGAEQPPDISGFSGKLSWLAETARKNGSIFQISEFDSKSPPNMKLGMSSRRAAGNIILQFAYIHAMGVEGCGFRRMQDGDSSVFENYRGPLRWYDADSGLLLPDGSPKLSLLAFANASEIFDGAGSAEYQNYGNGTRVIRFSSPRGPLLVTFSRDEFNQPWNVPGVTGYKNEWENDWGITRKETFYPIPGKIPVVRDIIGREKQLPVKDGKIEIDLNGEPVILVNVSTYPFQK